MTKETPKIVRRILQLLSIVGALLKLTSDRSWLDHSLGELHQEFSLEKIFVLCPFDPEEQTNLMTKYSESNFLLLTGLIKMINRLPGRVRNEDPAVLKAKKSLLNWIIGLTMNKDGRIRRNSTVGDG